MRKNVIETVMGAVVLIVAGLFVYFAFTTTQYRTVSGYPVSASFVRLGGLPVGSDVRISGVKVGTVTERKLDPLTFNAVVTMNISGDIALPRDTTAIIASEGLIGGKYIRLQPGSGEDRIEPGGTITDTRSFRSLEDQVGELIFLATGQKPGGDAPPGP
jgi:phospholipid/cholesterol/gamma-HCH transport system substrate-binding protein